MSRRSQKAWRRELVRIAGAWGQMRGFSRNVVLAMFKARRAMVRAMSSTLWGSEAPDPLEGVRIPRSLRRHIEPVRK